MSVQFGGEGAPVCFWTDLTFVTQSACIPPGDPPAPPEGYGYRARVDYGVVALQGSFGHTSNAFFAFGSGAAAGGTWISSMSYFPMQEGDYLVFNVMQLNRGPRVNDTAAPTEDEFVTWLDVGMGTSVAMPADFPGGDVVVFSGEVPPLPPLDPDWYYFIFAEADIYNEAGELVTSGAFVDLLVSDPDVDPVPPPDVVSATFLEGGVATQIPMYRIGSYAFQTLNYDMPDPVITSTHIVPAYVGLHDTCGPATIEFDGFIIEDASFFC